jgi:tRNA(adenine34) deaminase
MGIVVLCRGWAVCFKTIFTLIMLNSDKHYMQRAFELAQEAEQKGEVPIGAVVVYQDKIMGEGFNQPISLNDPTAHAEIIALRQAGATLKNYRLNECILYVTLQPCAMCAAAMVHARIQKVVYGASDPKSAGDLIFQSSLSEKLNHQVLGEGGCLENECAELLKNFFRERR